MNAGTYVKLEEIRYWYSNDQYICVLGGSSSLLSYLKTLAVNLVNFRNDVVSHNHIAKSESNQGPRALDLFTIHIRDISFWWPNSVVCPFCLHQMTKLEIEQTLIFLCRFVVFSVRCAILLASSRFAVEV